VRIRASQPLLDRAADLAEAFSLRAYNSVHLAAADIATKQSGEAVTFACYDLALNRAAHILGLPRLVDGR
jgi:hypothetical protein